MVDFVEICKVCARRTIIKAAKRIINSDKMCRSYSDLNFGVTFLEHSVHTSSSSSSFIKSYNNHKLIKTRTVEFQTNCISSDFVMRFLCPLDS